jgi:hypothetical protein
VVYVSRQLGHASPDITLRVYAHLFDAAEHSQKASDALDAALGNAEVTAGGDGRRNRAVATGGQVVDLQRKETDGNTWRQARPARQAGGHWFEPSTAHLASLTGGGSRRAEPGSAAASRR